MIAIIRKWMQRRKCRQECYQEEQEKGGRRENPCLPYIRQILEEILRQRGLDYKSLRLLVIDTDTEPETFFDKEEEMEILKQLSPDLNFLMIMTERPAYFGEYVETMYEETGLPVQIESKGHQCPGCINLVLDLEQKGDLYKLKLKEPYIYLPIYKKSWEIAENLDIYVPIGYNTVIVKGIRVV